MDLGLGLRTPLRIFLTFLWLSAEIVFAGDTRTWEQSRFDDLVKGTAQGVAINSAGGLELAPAFRAIITTPSTYIWSIAVDRNGILYAAAGSPARVYRITPEGKSVVIFEAQELQVQALAVDRNGAVFAATNPDGKVYKIAPAPTKESPKNAKAPEDKSKSPVDPGWSSSVYFDPGTKYIWDLAFDDAGNLYVATGDHGAIFRVSPKGEHSIFFQSDEAHIRALAFDHQGNLIAGSDGSGLIYRISPKGEAFVLYSAPKKEITALAIDNSGNIYAAGTGEKRAAASPTSFPVPQLSAPTPAGSATPQMSITISGATPSAPPPTISFPGTNAGVSGGSEIYKIAPDGSPRRLWSSHEDMVYALAFDPHGGLLAGTGNRGHIFAISGEDQFTDLVKASATQVTAFARAGDGLYASTSNLGKIFQLSATPAAEGTYESDVFDAHIFSRWGRAEFRGSGNVDLFARSGNVDNPDRNWSTWSKVDLQNDAVMTAPSARFVQWKAALHSGHVPPRVESVTLNYLPKNVAPDFDDVTVQVGVRFTPPPRMPGLEGSANSGQLHLDVPPPTTHDRDSIGVRWSVHDDNDDQMMYSVYCRGDGEKRWLLLKADLSDKFYSFDASLLPDGGYTVKVVASDAPSHSPGQALTAEKESARFEVDTTPPRIEGLAASVEEGQIHVSFRAADSFSSIRRAEYSIDAGDWRFVDPVGELSDSKAESYDFRVAMDSPALAASSQSDHVVVVRAYDRYDNMVSAKVVIRAK
jgi:WD40 repeat protein